MYLKIRYNSGCCQQTYKTSILKTVNFTEPTKIDASKY